MNADKRRFGSLCVHLRLFAAPFSILFLFRRACRVVVVQLFFAFSWRFLAIELER
jgi:hypothetical protein